VTTAGQAFTAWGAYDQDDPFPVFADARGLGPVHAVTLADGHEAWLVVRYDEPRALLNDPRLPKDMHAAMASNAEVVECAVDRRDRDQIGLNATRSMRQSVPALEPPEQKPRILAPRAAYAGASAQRGGAAVCQHAGGS
jgi:cytochrome P450